MHNPLGMCRLQRICDLNGQLEGFGYPESLAAKACFSVSPERNSITMNGRPS